VFIELGRLFGGKAAFLFLGLGQQGAHLGGEFGFLLTEFNQFFHVWFLVEINNVT
jgi:hypothetical protein